MPYSVVRFNCVQPGLEPAEMSSRYQAFVDMAEYADEHGFAGSRSRSTTAPTTAGARRR